MILGMSTATYTLLHVLISLAGIGSGLVVMFGLLAQKRLDGWTAVFLTTTALTSITGFGFPFHGLLPSHIVGIVSLVVLAIVIPARYAFRLAGPWRWIYVIGSAIALWFNVFVLIVQSFQKVPPLRELAPTQTEPPFVAAQVLALLIFATLAVFATVRFHPERVRAA
jgi:hypothetical protein